MSNNKNTGYFGGGTGASGTGVNGAGSTNSSSATNSTWASTNTGSYDTVNNGVTCEVQTCVHYCDGQKCNANVIHVGNTTANTSFETRCDTYKEKSSN